MNRIIVESGGPLKGRIAISGAKNSALSIIAASLLSSKEVTLENVPAIEDVHTQLSIIRSLGGEVKQNDNTVIINSEGICKFEVPYDLASLSRGSVLIWGALLSRWGKIKSGLPGGDKIGSRPINFFLKGCNFMNANVSINSCSIEIDAEKLRGSRVFLDRPSTTTTENIMILASLAKGVTIIENAESVPEIVDLANFLRKLGVKIVGDGSNEITIRGVKETSMVKRKDGISDSTVSSCIHKLIADPFEAGTFAIASAITGGEVILENALWSNMIPTLAKLREAGVVTKTLGRKGICVSGQRKINPVDIYVSAPYPAFQSDMQALFAPLLSKADGVSSITESVFVDRFNYTNELRKMGAQIKCEHSKAVITGVKELTGANVVATDIRGGASLILAGIVANGKTIIDNVFEIDRGYEKIDEKLRQIGANIRRS